MSEETKKDLKVVIGLVIACLILLIIEYSMFVKPASSPIVFVTPTNIGDTVIQQPTTAISNSFTQPSSLSGDKTSWFKGGTLHKSKAWQWRQATYANRLATAADFIAATQDVDYSNLDKFKEMATDLEKCMSIGVSGEGSDDIDTTFMASWCIAGMYPK